MNFPSYIAKRYLFSKSSNNAVNIITAVSVVGVAVGTMALLVVLSAFSGLEKFSISMLSTFDPDIKITPSEGKSFSYEAYIDSILKSHDDIAAYSKTLEEKVFLRYRDKEFISKIKGVDNNFLNVNVIDSTIYAGRWLSYNSDKEIIVGGGISHYLSLGLRDSFKGLEVYVVKPGKGQISDPMSSFRRKDAFPVGLFAIEKEIDEKYIIANLFFVQDLLHYDSSKVSAIEIKLGKGEKPDRIAKSLRQELGKSFVVKTQKEQHSLIYKMMNTEKVVTYLIFTLILIIAVFNVIGSISMLIVDKKSNLHTLWSFGASEILLRNIFVRVGLMITFIGGVSGIILGSALILLQYHFEFLTFGGTSAMAYPVELNITNIAVVTFTIFFIGFIASKLSVLRLKKELFNS
ncbi:MAG: ABC transporter permease [Flavobacteriales bacterium]|nr:ABC transporter permease [Flavobacteriales bacterium]